MRARCPAVWGLGQVVGGGLLVATAVLTNGASGGGGLTGQQIIARVQKTYEGIPAVAVSSPGTRFEGSTYILDILKRGSVVADVYRSRDPGEQSARVDLWPGGRRWYRREPGARCWSVGSGPAPSGGPLIDIDPALIGTPRPATFGWIVPYSYHAAGAGRMLLHEVIAVERRSYHVRYTDDGPGGSTRMAWRTYIHPQHLPQPTPRC